MTIYLGGDHASPALKTVLISFLHEKGVETVDCGTNSDESVDYPDFAEKVGEAVVNNPGSMGIVICGTGIGISIAANKIHGIRCANCTSVLMAEMARKHNDANILALGARLLTGEEAKNMVEVFLETAFEGGRHARRIEKITHLEQ
ncbi:MAG: ribose 5-phosphate isomerase B [Candidatus Peregrinibacteria bacterium]